MAVALLARDPELAALDALDLLLAWESGEGAAALVAAGAPARIGAGPRRPPSGVVCMVCRESSSVRDLSSAIPFFAYRVVSEVRSESSTYQYR